MLDPSVSTENAASAASIPVKSSVLSLIGMIIFKMENALNIPELPECSFVQQKHCGTQKFV